LASARSNPPADDVCVVGGGPAGAALALRLAQLGRRVVVVERSAFPRPHVGESLSPGIYPLLEVLGVREAVSAAGFLSSTWATVAWAGEQRRYQVQGGPGLLVDRGRFDALLLRAAGATPGVTLYQPARVREARRRDDHWEITLASGEALRASLLADAAGGAPLRMSPRSAGPRRLLGARTLALYAHWELEDRGDSAAETLVENGHESWYWGAPVPGGLFNAMVFVDPRGRRDYEALVQESPLLAARLRGRRRVSEVAACDATPSAAAVPITATTLKVGDAALFVDPISSQGVQTALGTALHAAIVLNTLIERPDDAELARGFYRRRLRDSAAFHATAAAGFYRAQANVTGHDFWRRRAIAAKEQSAFESEPASRTPRLSRPLTPTSRVARATGMALAPVAIASPSHVVRAEGVTVGGKEYAFVAGGVPLAPLLAQIEAPLSAFDIVARWSRTLPAREALQILQWAWEEALLAPADGS
jgi:flavin-dependent dehydrogenase